MESAKWASYSDEKSKDLPQYIKLKHTWKAENREKVSNYEESKERANKELGKSSHEKLTKQTGKTTRLYLSISDGLTPSILFRSAEEGGKEMDEIRLDLRKRQKS